MPSRLIHILAPARISRYRSFLKLNTNEQVYRAYCWNYALSAAVFPLLGCVEMHLRDAVHRTLSTQYAPKGTTNPTAYPWYDSTQPNHYPLHGKSINDVNNLLYDKKTGLRKSRQPTADDVVASLTFGFWTNLLRTFPPVQAPIIIPSIFPNHYISNPTQWGNKSNRENLNKHLRIVNDFRNRVAHHEPLFKFRYKTAYPKNIKTGLKNLQECVQDCLIMSGWIHPDARVSLEQSLWFKQFQELSMLDCFYSWVLVGIPNHLENSEIRCARFATSSMVGVLD
jgi:Abi-like protein